LTGYKSHVIKDYFLNYYTRYSDITVDMANNAVEIHNHRNEPWKVTMLYTGQDTMTGGRLLRAREFLNDEPFMLTYGDGVGDINIAKLLASHKEARKIVTVTSVQPQGKFGALSFGNDGTVLSFTEKPKGDGAWINGGFFVMESDIFKYLENGDETILEKESMQNLAQAGQLQAYKHTGFWRSMDTLKDKNDLNALWMSGKAPWATWLIQDTDQSVM
ncbi:MAG: glucose-1-phosphate cytidylyltransferase, partial [Tannerella sp.]|nr:glucose-1-phosphate cytidylyltransferase [Tannerella sp.]